MHLTYYRDGKCEEQAGEDKLPTKARTIAFVSVSLQNLVDSVSCWASFGRPVLTDMVPATITSVQRKAVHAVATA